MHALRSGLQSMFCGRCRIGDCKEDGCSQQIAMELGILIIIYSTYGN